MQITLDGKRLSGLKMLRGVIRKAQGTKVMRIATEKDVNRVAYGGNILQPGNHTELSAQISSVLNDMGLCHRSGKIYSSGGSIFTEKFAECLSRFLECFSTVIHGSRQLMITAPQMKDGLKWLVTVMKATECCGRSRQIQVENVIKKLEDQGVC
jgi:hypothetical protein